MVPTTGDDGNLSRSPDDPGLKARAGSYEYDIKTNERDKFGNGANDVAAKVDLLLLEYIEREQERSAAIAQDALNNGHQYNIDDNLMNYDDGLMEFHNPTPANAKTTAGSWIVLAGTEAGWDYYTLKDYFFKNFTLICERSQTKPETPGMANSFKAVIKIDSSTKLNQIIAKLRRNTSSVYFAWLSIVKTLEVPIAEADIDPDCDYRWEFLAKYSDNNTY